MKNIFKIFTMALFLGVFVSCDEDVVTFDADNGQTTLSFDRSSGTVGACVPMTDIVIESTTRSSSDRTYNMVLDQDATTADPSEYNVSTSIVIPAGEFLGSATLTVDFSQIPEGASRNLVYTLDPGADIINTRPTINISYASVCLLNDVSLNFIFDSWPGEAAYILRDGNGDIIDASRDATGAIAFGTFTGLETFQKSLCLDDGDYTITYFDAYGDGNTTGTGSYGVSLETCAGSSDLIVPLSSNAFDGNGITFGFTLDSLD
ncbi:MAG: hypothetical protein V7719_17285 [Psychroserpens sp.]|uniref:hypothetical protein n=1 Tax=Psychroserpens sp. TaxID=2020870 RepID=UPI0030032598